MKTFIVVLLLVISACAAATPIFRKALTPKEETIVYVEYYDCSKNDAFVAANAWLVKSFNSARDVIERSDKTAGIIVVKSQWPFTWIKKDKSGASVPVNYYVSYTMTFQTWNNKGKIEFHTGRLMNQHYQEEKLYLDKENMPKLLAYYDEIKDNLLIAINAKSGYF
jgi:hypothetical protein